jgi:farnesyl-diphosphate farnesyltransferase
MVFMNNDDSSPADGANRPDAEYRPGDGRSPGGRSGPRRSSGDGGGRRERERSRPAGARPAPARERGGGSSAETRRGGSRGGSRREQVVEYRSGGDPSSTGANPTQERVVADGPPAPDSREDLGGELLASVSRSFSLSIRLLPEALRAPISIGYLLARASDTIADTTNVPVPVRLEHLRALQEMIKLGRDPELMRAILKTFAAGQKHAGEGDLLKNLDRCLAWLEAQPPADLWDLRRTLARIGYGQELDLIRFGAASAEQPQSLATAAELADYTYFVAGCVGELWTHLSERHLAAGWSALPFAEMLILGKRFGQGLQMVNILRDLPADLAAGRCYLPADLLAQNGLEAAGLRNEPERVRPLLETLRQKTLEDLDAGWRYVRALKPNKMRYACSLPILIGLETLALLARQSPLETEERVKMSRGKLRGLMASAMVGSAVSPWLTGLHLRLRRKAGAKQEQG